MRVFTDKFFSKAKFSKCLWNIQLLNARNIVTIERIGIGNTIFMLTNFQWLFMGLVHKMFLYTDFQSILSLCINSFSSKNLCFLSHFCWNFVRFSWTNHGKRSFQRIFFHFYVNFGGIEGSNSGQNDILM